MSVEARTGRLRQRYDNNFRLVSGRGPGVGGKMGKYLNFDPA